MEKEKEIRGEILGGRNQSHRFRDLILSLGLLFDLRGAQRIDLLNVIEKNPLQEFPRCESAQTETQEGSTGRKRLEGKKRKGNLWRMSVFEEREKIDLMMEEEEIQPRS